MTPPALELEQAQRHFAEELRLVAGLTSDALVEAFATVPRERFLGPGPWKIGVQPRRLGGTHSYRETDDADPRHLCHNVLVAIDPERSLHNGLPSFLAFKIEGARIEPTDRVVHVGAGVGYYTAVMAELAREGRVTAIEVDADLAERARTNLEPWRNVEVVAADGSTFDPGEADVIFVNAGATHPAPIWLERLAVGGRLVLPLSYRDGPAARGIVLLVERRGGGLGFDATPLTGISVYDCAGARDDRWNAAIGGALEAGGINDIKSLVRADHDHGDDCWVHVDEVCVSKAELAD